MKDEKFTKLFIYMQGEFNKINDKLDKRLPRKVLKELINTIDGFVRRLDDNETKHSAHDMQFERLVEWAREVSKRLAFH